MTALDHAEQSVVLYHTHAHRSPEAPLAPGLSGILDADAVQTYAEAAVDVAAKHGFPVCWAMARVLLGWGLCSRGQEETGMAQIRQGLAF